VQREPRQDAAGAGHVAVGGTAAGPAALGGALRAVVRPSGGRDPQPPAGAAAAEAQRELGPRARGPGLATAGRAGGQSGAPPAQVSSGRAEGWTPRTGPARGAAGVRAEPQAGEERGPAPLSTVGAGS
jgi:hypothetical protein